MSRDVGGQSRQDFREERNQEAEQGTQRSVVLPGGLLGGFMHDLACELPGKGKC